MKIRLTEIFKGQKLTLSMFRGLGREMKVS
jgi:hypothetical protein